MEEDLLATRGHKRKADKQEEKKKREAARGGQARRREEPDAARGSCWNWKTATLLVGSENNVRQ